MVYEIMRISKQLKNAISATSDIQCVRDHAGGLGLKPLRLAGGKKVAMGITSIEEVMRVTPELGG